MPDRRFAIIVSRFNEVVTERLLAGARACFSDQGFSDSAIQVYSVPGAWELPVAALHAARSGVAGVVAIGCVVAQAWLGAVCPLTTLEMRLRAQAGEQTYTGGFIAHWVGRLLYHEAPDWVFTLAYSLFGLAVVLSWIRFPPVVGRRGRPSAH